jgi:outer membrane lipoprotein-sorting protein
MLNLARNYNYTMRLAILFAFLFFYTGCVPKQVPINYDEIKVDEILQLVKTNQESLRSLRGVARVKAKSRYDDLVVNQVTLLQLPLKFRLEALAAFGQSIAVLTSDGEKVILRTSNDQVVFPDVRNFNLSNFYPGIPSELKTEQLIDLLIGKIPFGLWLENYNIGFDKEAQKLAVEYKNSNNLNTVLIIDPLSGYIEHAEINLDESNILKIDYTNFTKLDNLVFPKSIDLKYLSYELSIKYGEINLNDYIDYSLFFQ